ncbi:CHAT domain-containing protein [Phytohabitans flavus]
MRPALLHNLAYAYGRRFKDTGSTADLDEAVRAARSGLELLSPGEPGWAVTRDHLRALLQARLQFAPRHGDLEELLRLRSDEPLARPAGDSLAAVVAALSRRITAFDAGDREAVLQPAVMQELTELMLGVLLDHDGVPPAHVARVVGDVHWRRHLALPPGAEAQEELAHAVQMLADAAEEDPASVPEPVLRILALPDVTADDVGRKARLAVALAARAEYTDDETLTMAIDLMEACAVAAPVGYADRAALLVALCFALRLRFLRTGAEEDLAAAVRVGTDAVESSRSAPAARRGAQANLGQARLAAFEHRGDPADLDGAIELLRAAVNGSTDADPSMLPARANLGTALLACFQHRSDAGALEEAIALLRTVVDETEADDPRLAIRLSNLANSLRSHFEQWGDQQILLEAARMGQRAIEVAASQPERAAYQSSLGQSLRLLFEETGQDGYLDEAVTVSRDAVANTVESHVDLGRRRSNLGILLLTRLRRTGRRIDLDEAVAAMRSAMQGRPTTNPDHALTLSNLGIALLTQFHYTGRRADLVEATAHTRTAVQVTPSDHPDRLMLLSNLGSVLQSRFEYDGIRDDLAETVRLLERAVTQLPPESRLRATVASNLSVVLAGQLGTAKEPDADTAVAAVRFARDAVAARPEESPSRAIALGNLVGVLVAQAQARPAETDEAELEEAVSAGREALSLLAGDHPAIAVVQANLATALRTRFERHRSDEDLQEALSLWTRAARLEAATPLHRLTAAREAAETRARWLGPSQAVDAYAEAVALLPRLAFRGVAMLDQQQMLRTHAATLARDAAACAIAAGRNELAVELLEQGRALYWSQLLDLRTDLTAIQARAGALADALADCLAVLEQPGPPGEDLHAADARMAAAQRFDDLVDQVRALPPTDDLPHPEAFLRPLSYRHIAAELPPGQVAVINISQWRCDALLVSPEGITVVPLGGITDEAITDVAGRYLGALRSFERRSDPAARPAMEQSISDTLSWLWDHICSPVLAAAGHVAAPQASWPRLWWCPTGALALLPLHASGHPTADHQSVYDRVVSSYVPTLRAFGPSAARAASKEPKILVVAVPEVAGGAQPPGSGLLSPAEDIATIRRYFRPEARTILDGEQATRTAVLEQLDRHRWLHASCHGTQDLADPAKGGLVPYDVMTSGLISTIDLTGPRQTGGELAFLSACKTATVGVTQPDEAITVAAALQYTGWRHTVGTLWSVWDMPSAAIAKTFYAALFAHSEVSADRSAYALHDAVRELRDSETYAARPSTWAPYVHFGW